MSRNPFQPHLAGLLIPVFACRRKHDFGIGDTQGMMEAIDFCAAQGFTVLQTLPIHDTIGDHSPYNPISSRALSPALLTMEVAQVPGLTEEILSELAPEEWLSQLREGVVKYHAVYAMKIKLLQAAYLAFKEGHELQHEFETFKNTEVDWLPAYTLFRVLAKEHEGNAHWPEWRPETHTFVGAEAWLTSHPEREDLVTLREGFAFMQWMAWRQWKKVREHADEKGIMLMGELSFGVSKSSVDLWQNAELFDIDWSMGTRPIAYFDTNKDSERWGQNWGLPPYRWENHRSTDFAWLRKRIQSESQFFHVCRLDHLRGYFRAYMFPWAGGNVHAQFATLNDEEVKAQTGGRMPRFVPGSDEDESASQMNDLQGREIIRVIREAAGEMYLFAEIMGAMPDYMKRALEELEIPNLTFPQLERKADRSLYPPSSFRELSLASYANHDHAPLAALYARLKEDAGHDEIAGKDLANLLGIAGWSEAAPETLSDELLAALQKALFETPCQLAVLMCMDLIGSPQRFNLPGSYGDQTWCERLELPFTDLQRHPVLGKRIAVASELVRESGRNGRL